MTGMGYDNPFADGAYIKKRIGTDLFLIFDIVRYGNMLTYHVIVMCRC